MAHSRLRKQSVLARSVELERSTSGAGEMLPGAVTPQFRAGRGFATTDSPSPGLVPPERPPQLGGPSNAFVGHYGDRGNIFSV